MTYQRNMTTPLIAALQDTPVLMIHGARQVGKSTLAKSLINANYQADYVTMDDATILAAARSDGDAFLSSFSGNVIIDEIQRAPELFLAIKKAVDLDRRAGRFILTGSANVLTLPKIADSLAGRMEIQTIWPLSQGELLGLNETFIDLLFSDEPIKNKTILSFEDICHKVLVGGFPEVVKRSQPDRQEQWFRSYLMSLIQRDIRDLANIEGLMEIPNLLNYLVNRAANLLNTADISRMSGISATTLKRYMALLKNIYLIVLLPPWSTQREKRLVKASKVYFNDTGMLCHLRKFTMKQLLQDRMEMGSIFENFVVMELLKQQGWSRAKPDMYHFRNHNGREVDVVLEAKDGKIAGIEIKLSTQIKSEDFAGLKFLSELAAERFHRGIIVYNGERVISFSEKLYAVPVSALWQTSEK